MDNINFDNWKARASAVGSIMTPPQSKEAKERGDLSETAKKYLYKAYAQDIWGKKTDLFNKYISKGIQVEDLSIALLNEIDKKEYYKNVIQLEDEYFKGTPDIIDIKGNKIIDIKSSFNAETYLDNVNSGLLANYEYQIRCYMEMSGITQAEVVFCLVNTPQELINDELFKATRRHNCIELPPEIEKEIINSMKFEDIPKEQRILRFKIDADEEIVAKMQKKVEKCREYLKEIHKKMLYLTC
jgi:hypothetical protein